MIPQPITIDGKAGTVVYLDATWHPTTPERATMAKVVFDDGSRTFYVTKENTQKWDEAKHPRDEEGQFAETGRQLQGDEDDPVEVYHGTAKDNLRKILKQGLRTSHAGLVWPTQSESGKVYLTTDEDDARRWAESAADQIYPGEPESPPIAILTIRIPKEHLSRLKEDAHFGVFNEPQRQFEGDIPPEWIIGAKIGTPLDPEGEYQWKVVKKDDQIIYVVVVLQPSAEKQPGVGGITQKFDEVKHPRGDDGRFIEATQPRIFNRPEEVGELKGWPGDPVRFGWIEEGRVTGQLLTGEPIARQDLPDVLYHVTTNAPAVEASGVLLGLLENGGLGGGQAPGVSFTASQEDAKVIQRELIRAVDIARGKVDFEDITRYAREDEREAGLPEGTLDPVLREVQQFVEGNLHSLEKTFVWDKDLPEEKRGWVGPPPSPAEKERLRRSLLKDALNSYLMSRERVAASVVGKPVPILKNPILFGRQEQLAKLDPLSIQILEVPSSQIPTGALVTTGSDKFLHEVRVYADVPMRLKKAAAGTMRDMRQVAAEIRAILAKRYPSYSTVLKWDPNQPRNPKGRGRESGRFRSASLQGQALGDISPGHKEFRAVTADDPGMARARQQMGATSIPPGMERGPNVFTVGPQGTGFENPPRVANMLLASMTKPLTGKRPQTPTEKAFLEEKVSELEDMGSGGANDAAKVTFEGGLKAVYKAEAKERWTGSFSNDQIEDYITNRQFSLGEREAIAYEIGEELFGDKNPVPVTVLRENLTGEVGDANLGSSSSSNSVLGPGTGTLRDEYDTYRQDAEERAMDYVGQQMEGKYQDDANEHADDIERRAEEMAEIWNEEAENYPDVSPYGSRTMIAEHPVLPVGTDQPKFFRRGVGGALDPVELLDEANIDPDGAMTDSEKGRVREIIRQKLKEGYDEFGDVDRTQAREHLDRDQWFEDHADTEANILDSQVQGFDTWRQSKYPQSSAPQQSGAFVRNSQAPHPNGGSLQHFHRDAEGWGDLSHDDGVRMAVLDYVIGSMDRHQGNVMYDPPDDAVVAIDNGYSMPGPDSPDGFRFRSQPVRTWMYSGNTSVPEAERAPILKALNDTDWQALVDRHPNMSQKERTAFLGRIDKMKDALAYNEGLSMLWRNQDLM